MTYEFARSKRVEQNNEEAKKRVVELRSEIHALGNVNLEAPQQYEEVSTRYEFLNKQKEDLVNAKNKILNAIDEMDDIMIKQFKESFNAINAQLNDEFRKLFGGGRASLKLVDPNDILNTGVDIDVQPPGKNIQNLTLLSGGEKSLVAICVLFFSQTHVVVAYAGQILMYVACLFTVISGVASFKTMSFLPIFLQFLTG